MRKIRVVFYGVDDWCRPVFREIFTSEDNQEYQEYGDMYFGDVCNLFDCNDPVEKIIDFYKDTINNRLSYFGSSFGCEPEGIPLNELDDPVELEFDIELTKEYWSVK